MNKKLKTIQKYFDFFTKNFEPDPAPKPVWVDFGNGRRMLQEYRIALPENIRVRHPYIVFIIFVYLKKFQFMGPWEKVAWEIPLKYKGTPLILTHRKFGFEIISYLENETITKRGIEAVTNIHKATQYAEILIEPHIRSLVQTGHITLDNGYRNIRNRYIFLRENASREYSQANGIKKIFEPEQGIGLEENIKSYNRFIRTINAGHYYMIAMLDAYFSLLEHTLVLLLPFLKNIDPEQVNLEDFIGKNWKEKYKVILPIISDTGALQLLERLDKIKKRVRNPLSHGNLLKNGLSFYVHMENLGAIPVTLTKSNNKFKYSFDENMQMEFQEICDCFDNCDTFFETHPLTKYGIRYIKSELSIAFDTKSCVQYKTFMTNGDEFNKFIENMSREHDDAANMDW
ncbi:hypothetical protein F9K33_12540 [bacterium]|nr:MAG: hypothetical protein F9K33_12540 [bacterium]